MGRRGKSDPSEWVDQKNGWYRRELPHFNGTRHGVHVNVDAIGRADTDHGRPTRYRWSIDVRLTPDVLTENDYVGTESEALQEADRKACMLSLGHDALCRGEKSRFFPDVSETTCAVCKRTVINPADHAAPACSVCKGHGSPPPTRMICRRCKGWGHEPAEGT